MEKGTSGMCTGDGETARPALGGRMGEPGDRDAAVPHFGVGSAMGAARGVVIMGRRGGCEAKPEGREGGEVTTFDGAVDLAAGAVVSFIVRWSASLWPHLEVVVWCDMDPVCEGTENTSKAMAQSLAAEQRNKPAPCLACRLRLRERARGEVR